MAPSPTPCARALRRTGLAVTLPALTGLLLVAPSSPAGAVDHDPAPVTAGAAWLESQLTNGLIHNEQYDFDDLGLSADVAFGLAAVGGHETTVDAITAAIEPRAKDEWYSYTFDGVTTVYAGSLAKAVVLAQTAGEDPTTFGGEDLVAALEDRAATAAPIAGRIEDLNNEFGDANVIGQAFASQGLAAAGSTDAAAVTSFLLQQQCDAGYFRLDVTPDKAAVDQTCQGGVGAGESAPDTDATALAMIALDAQATNPVVDAALEDAEAWLLDQQRANGGFGGGPSTEAPNTNSAGLAAWALGLRGQIAAAELSAGWVRGHQAVNVGHCVPWGTPELGAVAYNRAGWRAAQDEGITAATSDQFRRATAQALPALQYAPTQGTPLATRRSHSYFKARSDTTITVSGLTPGDLVCAWRQEFQTSRVIGATGVAKLTLTMPGGTGERTFKYADSDQLGDVTFSVLGRLEVPFRLAKRTVRPGGMQKVMVHGLAPHEFTTVQVGTTGQKSGNANAEGEFVARLPVGHELGKVVVRVYGQFVDLRKNRKSFTVAR